MSSAPEQHQMHHPTFKQYVLIATILFAVTIVEFLIILPGGWRGQGWTIAPLVILSAFKFAVVIMFYMHLKFDAPMFSVIFLAGLALALAVGMAAVGLFGSFTPSQRAFAEDNAKPFVHVEPSEGGGEHATAPAPIAVLPTPASQPDAPPPTAVPVAQPSAPADGADTAAGQAVFTGRAACFTCHTIDGIATGLLGPSLDGIATAAATRNPPQSAEDYIRESINDPDAFIWEGCVTGTNTPCPAGLMATLVTPANLTDAEIDAVVAFLLTQK
jgi:mono/diheme cytochrome c family protein/heme/copper-type cytochrome/quinol oxidase subunit 4